MSNNPFEKSESFKVFVSLNKPKSFTELLKDTQVMSSVLSRRLKELQECGLIKREETSNGRKSVIYSLDKDSEELLLSLKKVVVILKRKNLV